ncbi:MAG: hypothetical protein WB493_10315 [Anaeromyxobacteraceae bacterium]
MFLPLLVTALALAQVPDTHASGRRESIAAAGAVVSFGWQDGDEQVAEQVRRVLPAALRAAVRWGALPATLALEVHPTHAGLEQATGRTGNPWMRAWARTGSVDLQSPRTWTRGSASDDALLRILSHEITHCVLFEAAGREGRARGVPYWFQEGMASVAAGEHHEVAHPDAVTHPGPFLRTDPKVAYGTADRAFRELLRRFGEPRVRRLLSLLGEGQAFAVAFRDSMGEPLDEFESELGRRLTAVAALD